jgi:hypothetical protein
MTNQQLSMFEIEETEEKKLYNNDTVIKSISFEQNEILRNIIKLYIEEGYFHLDPTYSKGNFYKKGIKEPDYKFDLFPQTNDTVESSSDKLPIDNESINSILFDPVFTVGIPNSSKGKKGSNIIANRFGSFKTMCNLWEYYYGSLMEFHRILKNKKFLVIKCQDSVSSSKQYLSHVEIINQAEEIGFYCKDLFILNAKTRILSGKHSNQVHARKYHSYFLVFQKLDKNPVEKESLILKQKKGIEVLKNIYSDKEVDEIFERSKNNPKITLDECLASNESVKPKPSKEYKIK